MSSITYNGHDFSFCTTCEVVEGPHAVVPTAKEVPGRAGVLLLGGRLAPLVVRVRLFLDAGSALDAAGLSALKRQMYAWLYAPDGGVLALPGFPSLEWHDAVVTSVSPWSSATEDAGCETVFTCFDPVAFGDARSEVGATFEVGGTWPTWPTFELTASAGSAVQVGCNGEYVRVEGSFIGGEVIVIDCANEVVTIDGVDGRADVTMASDFFCLEPGEVVLSFAGCSTHETRYNERWL